MPPRPESNVFFLGYLIESGRFGELSALEIRYLCFYWKAMETNKLPNVHWAVQGLRGEFSEELLHLFYP